MHAARRTFSPRCGATRRPSQEKTWFRLSTKDWDFFVADEVEAFAVIARHDVIDVERIFPAESVRRWRSGSGR